MKKTLLVLLMCCPLFAQDDITVKAIEGAKLLHSAARDPDSFKIGRAWIMRSEKYDDAICYDYYARNGYGGMNHSQAVYTTPANKRYKDRSFRLHADEEYSPVFESRCGSHAVKHDVFVKDVTKEIKQALQDEVDNAKP